MKLASLAAIALLGLTACAGDEGEKQEANLQPAPELRTAQAAVTGSIPVTVVNGQNEPVPTTVKGTAQVAGTVGLSPGTSVGISGTPSVNVANAVGLDPTRNDVNGCRCRRSSAR